MLYASNARISGHMGGAFVGGGTGSMLKLKRVWRLQSILLQYDRYKAYSNSSSLKIILIYSLLRAENCQQQQTTRRNKKRKQHTIFDNNVMITIPVLT